jgi:hypothetical protein
MDAHTVQEMIRWSEALAGIARTGLGFTDNLYERERFEEVLRVAADIRIAAAGRLEEALPGGPHGRADQVVEEWLKTVG